jgi:hypothetical protein
MLHDCPINPFTAWAICVSAANHRHSSPQHHPCLKCALNVQLLGRLDPRYLDNAFSTCSSQDGIYGTFKSVREDALHTLNFIQFLEALRHLAAHCPMHLDNVLHMDECMVCLVYIVCMAEMLTW